MSEKFSRKDAKGVLAGSFASPLYSVGVEEAGHYLALKMLGEDPRVGIDLDGSISEMAFYVTSSGKELTELGEGIVSASGPMSVLALSGLTAYYSQKIENKRTRRFLEGISITSALSSALYCLGDYVNFTQGDFEMLSETLPYQASIPITLIGAAAVMGYTKGTWLKEYISDLGGYVDEFLSRDEDYGYCDESSDEYNPVEYEQMSEEEYNGMVDTIESLKKSDPGTEEWKDSLDELENNYDVNPYFIEDAAMVYREGIDREKNDL